MFKKTLSFLVISLLALSCASITNLQILSQKEQNLKSRGDYKAYLALEYLQFSRNLVVGNSKHDSEYFAKKGLSLLSGKEIVPENPLNWDADLVQMEELVAMQKRLELLMDPEILTNMPIQMAHLTYLYDCWASKESKSIFRAADLSKCRDRFYKLLEELEYYVDYLEKDKQPRTRIIEPKFKRFDIFFDLSSHKFNDEANKDFLKILKYLTSLKKSYKVLLVGNTDRTGSNLYNQSLSLKRSATVKNYLVKNGVSKDLIQTRSLGENFPDIITKDGVQQQRNRSVSIYILTGVKSFSGYPLPVIENFIYKENIKQTRVKRGLSS